MFLRNVGLYPDYTELNQKALFFSLKFVTDPFLKSY
jgi:hypothetical protein